MLSKLRQTMCRAWRVAAAAVLLAMLTGATCPAADPAPVADAGAGATPAASAPLTDAAATPSRLLPLMPESWLPSKPASPKPQGEAPVKPDKASAELGFDPDASLADAGRTAGGGVRETDGIEKLPKPGPWRGAVGVSAGTHDYWGTWMAVERDIIPDRVTFGLSTSAGSYPCWWYRPRPWDDAWW